MTAKIKFIIKYEPKAIIMKKKLEPNINWPESTKYLSLDDQPSKVRVSKIRTIVCSKLLKLFEL